MKTIYTFLFIIIYLLFVSETFSQNSKLGILLVDKTTSLSSGDFVTAKNEKTLKKILKGYTKKEGDKIILSYIFGNTLSAANKTSWSYLPPTQQKGQRSTADQKLADINYANQLRSFKSGFKKKIAKAFFDSPMDSSGTKIFGSLKNVENFINQHPDWKTDIYLFSDLKEYSDIAKLYSSGEETFGSRQEAEKAVIEYLHIAVQKYQIDTTAFSSINSLTVILPASELSRDSSLEMLPVFWRKVFSALSISNVSFK